MALKRTMTHFNIDIISDTVCPWCYVGHKRLTRAIAQHTQRHPADTFTTAWHAFYLDPTAPTPGEDKQARYERRFGATRTRMMQERLAQIGAQEGIAFKFGGRTGNTRDSHRLVALGRAKGGEAQTRVVEALFNAYFEEAKRRFVSGVPHFTVNGRWEVGGAEEPESFLEVFEEVKRAEK